MELKLTTLEVLFVSTPSAPTVGRKVQQISSPPVAHLLARPLFLPSSRFFWLPGACIPATC